MADIITLIVGSVALYLVNLIVGIVAPYLLGLFNAVAPHLLNLIGRELDYLFHYRRNIEKLGKEVDELQKVSERIEADWTNAGEIELVQEWLTSVDGIIKNALKFLEDEKKENEGFFNRLCAWLNLKSWYQKSKKAKQTAAEIVRIQDGKQLPSSPPPRKIRIPAVEGYEAFKSRMPILNKIMESLRNANVNLIGVYGMGGTGKTTLVKEIAKKCEEDKLFDEVVIATVSQPLNITNIQGEIADKLNLTLTLKEETKSGRAGRLCEELKKLLVDKKQSILVILDDIWEKLNLAEVGIPFGDNYRGCKVVMTSRNQHVLSNEMCTQETFNIEVLWEEEAWDLFKKIAGDSIEDHDRKPIARGIVEECARLPIAIVTVANALKNKRVPIWKDALREQKKSTPTGIKGMEQKVYSALKWSYDFLEDEKAKSLFLLCSLLPEDYQFSILDILKFGEGVDLFQGINLLEDARNKVDTLVNTLTDSSLLLHDKTTTGFRMLDIARDKHFRMHDIVRDVGISVASKDKQMLIVRNDDELAERMTKEKLRNCLAISLPYSSIHELPTGLKCPKLKLFLFFSNDRSLKIPDTFFEGMKQLRVLNLRNMCFPSLPSSLHFLSNLRTLCLDHCVFQDIPRHDLARIGELKKLEVLSFASSDIAELPREIGQLTCLRLLDLSDCFKLKVIPPNVIEKFTQLEDLYMGNSFVGWEVDGNASLAELKDLSRLVTLDIHIEDTNILPKDLRFENLMRYRIFIGDGRDWYGDYETSRILKLKLKTSIEQFGLNLLLEKTEDLYLGEMNGNKNGLCSSNREVFPQLRHLHVQKGCEMEYVVNTLELIPDKAFPELRSLFLHNLINLKKICRGQLPTKSFRNLRIVEVKCCDSLENLFSLSVVKGLLQLQTLKVNECKIMDEIVSEASEGSEGNNEAMGKITFPQLRSLELDTLPKLSSFYSKKQTSRPFNNYAPTTDAGSGEIISKDEDDISIPLFNEKVAFPNLEKLYIWNVNSLKEIWSSQLPVHDDSFCKLTSLQVGLCHNLRHIFTTSIAKSLEQLQQLRIVYSTNVEEIVENEGVEEESMGKIVFPRLTSLTLEDLPQLKSFCQGILNVETFSLESSSFEESCGKGHVGTPTKPLFLVDKVGFPNLEELVIQNVNSLKEIWPPQLTVDDGSFCELKSFRVQSCDHLLSIIPSNMLMRLQNMERLTVDSCGSSLEYIFDLRGLNDKERHVELRDLCLRSLLGLKQIWKKDPQTNFLWQKLSSLEVFNCGNLRSIFTTSMVKSLKQLQNLSVMTCKMVEEIVEEEGVEEQATDKIAFPLLTSLTLTDLPQLKSFWQGSHILEWPSSKKLVGIGSDYMEINALKSSSFEEMCGKDHLGTPTKQPLFLVDKVGFPNLEKLFIMKVNSLKGMWPSQLAVDDGSFCKLKSFCVLDCSGSLECIFDFGRLNDKEKHVELRDLSLMHLPGLKQIWKKDPQTNFLCRKLSSVEVSYCENLRSIFTTSMVQSLKQLQKLSIRQCELVEEIVEGEGVKEQATDKLEFPELTSLTLEVLPQLKSFCRGSLLEWPSSKKLDVSGSDNGEIFALESSNFQEMRGKDHLGTLTKQTLFLVDKVAFPNLEELKLRTMSSMKEIWQDQYHTSSFGKLRVLEVKDCESLTHVLTFAIGKSLVQIKSIIVDNCKMMKEVITSEEEEETDETTFSQLNSLKLRDLSNLTSFCARSNTFLFPSLEDVLVEKCPELKTFSYGSVHTPKLDKVHVQSGEDDFGDNVDDELLLLDKGFWKGDLNRTIQYLFEQKMEFLRFSELSELKQICHDQFPVEGCYVQDLVVEKCPSLLNVVSSIMLESLPKLKKITVESCDSLEEVFDLEGLDCDEKRHALVLDLEEMNLTRLPKLRCIWNKDPKVILSFNLLQLNIEKCNSLRSLFSLSMVSKLHNFNGLKIIDCLNMKEIVEKEKGAKEEAIDEITFQLGSIILQGLPSLTSFYPGNHTLVFYWLSTMKIAGCPRIKTFSSTNEGLQESFGDGNIDVPSGALFINNKVEFLRLEELELEDLYSIKEIWQGQLHGKSFCDLTTLTVRSCQNLTHLLPFEIAKCLVQIKRIIVDGCKMMKEIIVSEEGEAADHETTFSRLSSLKLRSLPNLSNFCTGSNTFSFPSLEQVLVEECPKLKTFSNGILNTPQLEKVQVQEDEWVWKGDLNTTIEHLFVQKGDHL